MESDEAKCVAERDRGLCVCGGAGGGAEGGAAALAAALDGVRRAYEERLAVVLASHRPDKLQLQVSVLEEWVRDLTAQNVLLAATVEELETTVTDKLLPERRRLAETACDLRVETALLRRRLTRRDADLQGLLEVLRRLRDTDREAAHVIDFNNVTKSEIFGPQPERPEQLNQGDGTSLLTPR